MGKTCYGSMDNGESVRGETVREEPLYKVFGQWLTLDDILEVFGMEAYDFELLVVKRRIIPDDIIIHVKGDPYPRRRLSVEAHARYRKNVKTVLIIEKDGRVFYKKNRIGEVFGKRVVTGIGFLVKRDKKGADVCWAWKCSCENIGISYLSSLIKRPVCNMHGLVKSTSKKEYAKWENPKWKNQTDAERAQEVGKRYNGRTIIAYLGKYETARGTTFRWEAICDKGHKTVSTIANFKECSCQKCKGIQRSEKLIGGKYGSITLVSRCDAANGSSKTRKWRWRCICGNEGETCLFWLKECNGNVCTVCRAKTRLLRNDQKKIAKRKWRWVDCFYSDGKRTRVKNRVGEKYGEMTIVSFGRIEKRVFPKTEQTVVSWNWKCTCGLRGMSHFKTIEMNQVHQRCCLGIERRKVV